MGGGGFVNILGKAVGTIFGFTTPLGFLGQIALGLASSVVLSALAPKPKRPNIDLASAVRGRQQMVRQALIVRRTIYGRVQVSGGVIFAESYSQDTANQNEKLSIILAIAGHEVDAFEAYKFDDQDITLSGDAVQGDFLGFANIYEHAGTAAQAADAELVARLPGKWTADHRLRGIAYVHVKYTYDQSRYPSGAPDVRVVVRGKKIYDPRDAATRWSPNAALALRDYLVSRLGLTAAEIDDTTVSAAANVCEEQVNVVQSSQPFTADAATDVLTLGAGLRGLGYGDGVQVASAGTLPPGLAAATTYYWIPITLSTGKVATTYANAVAGTAIDITGAGSGTHTLTRMFEPRYAINGTVDDSERPGDAVRRLLSAMAGTLLMIGGKWEIHAGASVAATVTLDEDDLSGPISVDPAMPRRELFNAVKPTFVDTYGDWQATTAPVLTNAIYEAADGGNRIWRNTEYPFTTSASAAQRLAKIELERHRQPLTVSFPAQLSALRLKVWDVVNVTNERFAWSAKPFRIVGLKLMPDLKVRLTLQEETAAVWSWTQEETNVTQAAALAVPTGRTLAAPGGIAVTEALRTTGSGNVITVLTATVTAVEDAFVQRYEIEFKKSAATAWIGVNAGPGAVAEIPGVIDGTPYDIRSRAVNAIGVRSDWTQVSYTPIGQAAPPADVTGLALNALAGAGHLSWDAVADVDLSHYRVRWGPATAGVTWGGSVDLIARVARPATAAVVPLRTGTYLVKAVDLKGNESAGAISVVAQINAVSGRNLVVTVTEQPAFAGVTDANAAVQAGALQLNGTNTAASWTALSDVSVIALDGGTGFATPGIYNFAGTVDLGATFTSRLTASITSANSNYGNLIRHWATLAGVTKVGSANDGSASAALELRTTTDDPAGSPTWTAWLPFAVGDYRARAYQFRARLTTDFASTVTPIVSALSVTVDMPDRVDSGSGLTLTGGDLTVTFSPGYYATPEIVISSTDLASGDFAAVLNKAKTGFDISFKDSGGVRVARNFDWQAKGYGEAA